MKNNFFIKIFIAALLLAIIIAAISILVCRLQKYDSLSLGHDADTSRKAETLILKRLEGWGPCPKDLTCTLDVYLYDSGRMVFEGDANKEINISEEEVENIVNEIRRSGVMGKDCSGSMVFDYSVTYELNVDGKKKELGLEDTKCWDDLMEVNKLINSHNKDFQYQGGA
jgi:hypothetical protein